MDYKELKEKQGKEVNDFLNKYSFFAFSEEQFKDGCKKLNLDAEKDLNKLVEIVGGGYLLKEHKDEYIALSKKIAKEIEDEIKKDETGLNFCYSMFAYELANHEYGYTYEVEDTLDALDLTLNKVMQTPNLKAGLEKALAEYKED